MLYFKKINLCRYHELVGSEFVGGVGSGYRKWARGHPWREFRSVDNSMCKRIPEFVEDDLVVESCEGCSRVS